MTTSGSTTQFCGSCGTAAVPGARFCSVCGAAIPAAVVEPPVHPQQAAAPLRPRITPPADDFADRTVTRAELEAMRTRIAQPKPPTPDAGLVPDPPAYPQPQQYGPPAVTPPESWVALPATPSDPPMWEQLPLATPLPPAYVPPVTPPLPPAPQTPPAGPALPTMAPVTVGGRMVPPELLAIIGLMLVAAAFCFYIGLRPLSVTLQTLTDGEFGFEFGLVILTALLLFNLFGVALLYLARGLWKADKVARGLTFVLLGSVALTLVLARYKTTGMKWAIGVSLVALAVLALSPGLTRFFREGPDAALPTPIAIAVTLIKTWAGVVGIVGLSLLPVGTQVGKLFAVGVVMVALAAAGWWTAQAVLARSQTGRYAATVGTGIYLILLVIAGREYTSVIAPFAVGLGVIAFLWLPVESSVWFGTAPVRPADPSQYPGP